MKNNHTSCINNSSQQSSHFFKSLKRLFNPEALDFFITEIDHALKTLTVSPISNTPSPTDLVTDPVTELKTSAPPLTPEETKNSGSLVRVNHTGEICAQALYRGQAFLADNPKTRSYLLQAAAEENDHLAWCQARLKTLNTHPSYLNFFWYTHSWLIGLTAALWSDSLSLGFVVETENQVIAHLNTHLEKLSKSDIKTRLIFEQMKKDEAHHAQTALQEGAMTTLPKPIQILMRWVSKIMTTTAFYI